MNVTIHVQVAIDDLLQSQNQKKTFITSIFPNSFLLIG